tara:strand:+ start:8135 stop:8425 length:291 start_codon:yes stop_codon:yes gene_type:complete
MEEIFQALENLNIDFRRANDIAGVVLTPFEFAFMETEKIIIVPDNGTSGFAEFITAQGFTIHRIKKGNEEEQLSKIFNISQQEDDQTTVSTDQPTS